MVFVHNQSYFCCILVAVLKIGVIIPSTGYFPIASRSAPAIAMAIDNINKDNSILHNYTLAYNIKDDGCNIELGLRAMVGFWDEGNQPVDAFLGPACSTVMEPSAHLARIWDRPIIGYGSSAYKFRDKKVYSNLVRITPYARANTQYTPKIMAQLVQTFNWTLCGILSSIEVEWTLIAREIVTEFVKSGVTVSYFQVFDPNASMFSTILKRGQNSTRGE